MKELCSAFSDDVLVELARPLVSHDPRNAEMVAGVAPTWHLIETYSNSEREVALELSKRRFGVFVPEVEEIVIRRGRKLDCVRPMFPGYLFVFVWDVLGHRDRIENISGVMRLVFFHDGKPAVISDKMIDQIRAVENSKRPLPLPVVRAMAQKRGKKRWRKSCTVMSENEADNEIIAVRAWSAFQDALVTLDSGTLNQALRTALGLS